MVNQSERPGKISSRALFFVLTTSRLTTIIIFMPVVTAGNALEDAWASALLAMVLSVPLALFIVWASQRFDETGIIVTARKHWGLAAILVLAPLLVILILIPGYHSAQMGLLFTTVALSETPAGVIIAATLTLGAYSAAKGLDTIGRVAQIIFMSSMVVFAVTIIGVVRHVDTGRLLPHFARGLAPVFGGAIVPVGWSVLHLSVLPVFTGAVSRNAKGMRAAAVGSVVASYIVLTIAAALATVTFGAQEAKEMLSPAYMLGKSISIARTLEGLEALVLTSWIGVIGVDVGIFIYAASQAIAELTGSLSHRPYILPVAMASAATANTLFASVYRVKEYGPILISAASAVYLGLLLVLVLTLRRSEAKRSGSE